MIKEEFVKFKNSKGKELWGILSLPAEGSDFPGLIICHGFNQTCSQRKFVELARVLAGNGIAVFRFDFTGQGNSEGALEEISITDEVEDLELAFGIFSLDNRLNKKRITIFGHSLGALIAVLFQKKYKKAKTLILLSPALHQKELMKEWHITEEIELWKKQRYLDTPKGRIGIQYFEEATEKGWSESASQIEIPTLIIYGKEDDDVPVKYTEDVFRKISGEKKLEIIENADHHFESFQAKNELITLSLAWLKKYL